jgi:thiol-disulfide isomerase/thioredoxin
VLDCWYRGCGYCIDAMLEMKHFADDFKNEPVVVVGSNVDDDEKDAAFIADKMGLNYPTLLAHDAP